ncbi:receptor-like protein kinase HSL1 [Spinacia oleracea]|uniref:Receptor-like protein kinase HSL1 n=1 Tax=Spinacia oleracea TaxID=3562 RepID=A0ABM3RTB6_SPIOL|nr:receptor-like protein kinase HSL1 [Spinacia oleracea]
MTNQPFSHTKFLLLFSTLLPFLVISQSPPSDQEILLQIKQEWGNQSQIQSWNSTTSHCQWVGINCTGGESVTGISLNSLNIEVEIPSSICHLKNLTYLDLGNNRIPGNFPTFLYNCTKLQTLDLSANYFVGELPNDIDNLSLDLQLLNLSLNNFTGNIPTSLGRVKGLITLHLDSNLFNGTFPSELGDLENLETLVLAYNPFTPTKLPENFGKLKNLKFLWMTQCNLIGEIPKSFADLASLEHLDLVDNSLEGGIPSGLFLLKNLEFLYLYQNLLSGGLPTSIEALNLVELDISQNNMTGIIPDDIGKLQNLTILKLFQNQFHGTLPPSISQLPSLTQVRVFKNRLSGTLPPEMGLHSKLDSFEVSENAFTGQLPENLCLNGKLRGVVAFNNYLNGTIPSSLGQCKSLLVVEVYNNSLSGEVPEGLWTSEKMMFMQLSNNQFSGQLPEMTAENLSLVELSNNKFSGKIPESIKTWRNLQVFKASNNMITGTVPLELTTLSQLNTLLLDGNQLSGELPSEIISWERLNSLDLSHNDISGSIPSVFGSLPVLTSLDLSNNQFSGQIPPELGQIKAPSLNFSSNQLTGEIPFGIDNSAYQASFLNTHLCSDTGFLDLPKCSIRQRNPNLSSKYLALIIVLALVALVVTLYYMVFIIREIRQRKNRQDLDTWKLTSFHKLHFTEEKILANLTEKNMIGSGGSGKVYWIPINQSGDAVAVKRIWSNKKMSSHLEKEFLAEVQILGTIRHLNIVKLLCCISSENSKMLVYEYMEKQSLDKWIHEGKRETISSMSGSIHYPVLDWPARLKIAIDSAQGLSYMHNDCSPPIIHRDVKSSNILLDSEFNAKIADFGLAKILAKPGGEPYTVSAVAGSFGYMAPEYCHTTKVNEKIDIYSFGVVLLELVTGKEPHIGDEHTNLAEWALRHYNEGNPIKDVLDKEVQEPCYLEEMTNVFKIGLMCTSALPIYRPTMKEVLQMLQRRSILEGSGGAKTKNDRDVSPLLGGENYISSCKNSKRIVEEDVYSMV